MAAERAAHARRAPGRAVAPYLERGGDVERAVEHAGARGPHQRQAGGRRSRAAALGVGQPAGVAEQHGDHPGGQRRGQRGAERDPAKQAQHLVGIDRGGVQRAAQDQRDRAQAEHGAVGRGLEGDVGVAEQGQVAEAERSP